MGSSQIENVVLVSRFLDVFAEHSCLLQPEKMLMRAVTVNQNNELKNALRGAVGSADHYSSSSHNIHKLYLNSEFCHR